MVKRVHFRVEGLVQGVFYRKCTIGKAEVLKLRGWVRNRRDGSVEVMAEGDEDKIDNLIAWCRSEGSPASRVTALEELPFNEQLPAIGETFRKEETL